MRMKSLVTSQQVSETMYHTARRLRRVMTDEEKILWRNLRAHRLAAFHFRRQQIIGKYVADFYCHAAGVVIEVDGEIHDQQVERDMERDAELTGLGLIVLRFRNEQINNNLRGVLERIAETCRARDSRR